MKTDNVLVSRDGRVAITDFGIASALSEPGCNLHAGSPISGTPAYMSPEQARGYGRIDTRADLYALGVMLFQLYTGRLPFFGDSAMAVTLARLYEDPQDPRRLRSDLEDPLAELVLRCLRRDPEQRFQTALDVSAALDAHTPNGPTLRQYLQTRLPRREAGGFLGVDKTAALPGSERAEHTSTAAQALTVDSDQLPPLATPARTADPFELTVAVLPFRFTEGETDAYQAFGLTEAVIHRLSESPGLRVMGFGIVRSLPRVENDAESLGRQLLVKAVVDGSLRRVDGGLEASVRLLDIDSRLQFAARTIERKDGNILALAATLTAHICSLLSIRSERQTGTMQPQLLDDPQAMDLYLRARHQYHRLSVSGIAKSCELFEQALLLCPDEPTILTGYAKALVRSGFFLDVRSMERAVGVAERAAQLATASGEPQLALALVQVQQGQLAQAARTLRRTLACSPNLLSAHEVVGSLLGETGPLDVATRHLNAARMGEGFSAQLRAAMSRALILQGQVEAGLAIFDIERAEPAYGRMAFMGLSRVLGWLDQPERAQRLLSHPLLQRPEYQEPRTRLEFVSGRVRPRAEDLLPGFYGNQALSQRARMFSHQLLTEFHCILREYEPALSQLSAGAEAGLIDLMWLERCPLLSPLRTMPGYEKSHEQIRKRALDVQRAFGLADGAAEQTTELPAIEHPSSPY
ncbi:MAG: protein kinase [Myxococcales bacterium]|nr:protein kinase [Myxococcales bacterium]